MVSTGSRIQTFNNAKILLMEYILKIINNDLDNAEKLEECLNGIF